MAGRPRIPIDKEELAKWARAGCTHAEIAARLGISQTTFERRIRTKEYAGLIPKSVAELKMSLRAKQVAMALAGDRVMLIWLGKNLLGQVDKMEHSGQIDSTITDAEHSTEMATLRARVARIAERERAAGILPISDAERTGTD